jgi:long-chain acyl-CoA synthetase
VTQGEVGQIIVGGDNVALGYFGEPSDATFKDGMLFTGDIGRLDEDGDLYIVDRAKDFIKCGGNRVASKAIESVLLSAPEVIEAAIFGVPDDLLGEAVKAVVVVRDASDPSLQMRLQRLCELRLPAHAVPRHWRFSSALPKNSAGKVLKRQLLEEV